jgi:hypothetical protein
MSDLTHRPSGSMCIACLHNERDCSFLPFASMPLMKRDKDGMLVVQCTDFQRAAAPEVKP